MLSQSMGGGIGAAVGTMQEALTRLEYRMSYLNEYGPKWAAWGAQYLVNAAVGSDDVAVARRLLEAAAVLAETLPELAERERIAILEGIDLERVRLLDHVNAQRERSLEFLSLERAATVGVRCSCRSI